VTAKGRARAWIAAARVLNRAEEGGAFDDVLAELREAEHGHGASAATYGAQEEARRKLIEGAREILDGVALDGAEIRGNLEPRGLLFDRRSDPSRDLPSRRLAGAGHETPNRLLN
jgi:hypothetical protein